MARSGGGDIHVVSNAELSEEPQLDATKIVSVLIRHDVRFVLIGAFAAIAQGAPIAATRDLDFTPDESADNLASLSTVLKELDARIRTDSLAGGIPSTTTETHVAVLPSGT
jgi:hypothetical protein